MGQPNRTVHLKTDMPSQYISVSDVNKRKRRYLSIQYKLKVLDTVANLPHGEKGGFLEKEGLHHSQVAQWRRQKKQGNYDIFVAKQRVDDRGSMQRLEELELENEHLRHLLQEARVQLSMQKSVIKTIKAIAQSVADEQDAQLLQQSEFLQNR